VCVPVHAQDRQTHSRSCFQYRIIGTYLYRLGFLHGSSKSKESSVSTSHIASLSTFNNNTSILISFANVIEKRLQFRPGIYNYGTSSKEVILISGASISGDYHDKRKIWFQVFAMGSSMLEKNKCHFTNEEVNRTLYDNGTLPLRQWDEIENEVFLCRIGKRDAAFQLIPTIGSDPNTNHIVQVYRCPLHSILSDSEVENLYRHTVNDNMALDIEILHKNRLNDTYSEVAKIHLPINEPTVGVHEVASPLPSNKPFLQQRHNMTLCVVVHVNGITQLNEFIRYHHDVVGIDHIHVGVFMQHSKGEDETILHIVNRLYKPDIDAGTLTVSALWNEASIGIDCEYQHMPKISFYQQCLYRAKSTSDFVGTWDLDEYFLFKDIDTMIQQQQNLPSILRAIDHSECTDWCFVTIKSSIAGGGLPQEESIGLAVLDFPQRANVTNTQWQKSISRTKNVFLNSFHTPGSCLPEGKTNISDVIKMSPADGKCAFYIDEAVMVHVRGVQTYGGGYEIPSNEQAIENELLKRLIGND